MERRFAIFAALVVALSFSVRAGDSAAGTGNKDPRPTPVMSAVEPNSGCSGDVLTAVGSHLGDEFVRELYLTDGTTDIKAEIVEQSASSIRFKIPATAKPMRYRLMVLTTEEPPFLLEQPAAFLTVLESR